MFKQLGFYGACLLFGVGAILEDEPFLGFGILTFAGAIASFSNQAPQWLGFGLVGHSVVLFVTFSIQLAISESGSAG